MKFKEKYIKVRKQKNGLYSFQVRFDYLNSDEEICSYVQTFNEQDYDSAKDAFKVAVNHKNEMLVNLRGSNTKQIYTSTRKATKGNATVKYFFSQYDKYYAYSIETRKKHQVVYNQSIQPFESKNIYDITSADIQRSIACRVNEFSNDKLGRILSVWRILFRTAILLGYTKYDPTISIIIPESKVVRNPRGTETSIETVKAVTNAILIYSNKPETKFNYQLIYYAIWFAYYTGFRPSEVFMMRKSRIDFEKEIIYLRSRIGSTTDEKFVEVDVKTKKSLREYPLIPKLKELILEIIKFQNNDSDFLFLASNGKVLNSTYVSDVIARVAKNLGVEFNMYRLRNLFSKEIQKTGASAKTVIELMGHVSIGQSIDYDFTNIEEKRKALLERKYS